ncbi:MAG: LAGLIDADG family homing endonuclease, partial [bacterium]|nr:LAGLIDADG family homing endonuclease [bacterium]
RKDHTLSEIVRITGRPKTSVHFHIQNFPLSNLRKKEVQAARALRARLLAGKRRGVSARLFKKFTSWNTELICLVSHLVFDGEVKHGGCVYNNRNMALLNRVEQCMKIIYPLEPKRYVDAVTGVSRISYYNVALAAYIKEKSIKLLNEIEKLPKELRREFLRSFFDDEGCMDYNVNKKHRRIRGYQKNVSILHLVRKLLSDLGIQSRVVPPNEVVITGKENLLKFQKEINFSPGVRINGDRPNSVWKQHLEKREILRRAIESYRPLGSNGVHRTLVT